MTVTTGLQLLLNGIVVGGLLGLVALGLALIFGVMRLVNFAHGEFITLGAYATWLLAGGLGLSPLLGIPLSFLLAAGIGWGVQAAVLGRLAGRPPLDLLMATYALSIIGLGLFALGFGGDFRSYAGGPTGDVRFAGVSVGMRSLAVLIVCAVLAGLVLLLLRSARTGLALRALAQNRDAAAACGIDVRRTERLTFALAVGLAAVAGSLVSLIGTTAPQVGHDWVLDGFVVVVIGGLGSIGGALAAAVAIGLVQSLCGFALDDSWAHIIVYLLLNATLLLRPHGLLGQQGAA